METVEEQREQQRQRNRRDLRGEDSLDSSMANQADAPDPNAVRLEAIRERRREYLIREGPILWRTCSKTAYIPISRIGAMAGADYSNAAEGAPQTSWQAIESYLLIETLSAVHYHTVL